MSDDSATPIRRVRVRMDQRTAPSEAGLPSPQPPLSSLYFGRASAENEVKEDPERFLRTYLDAYDLPRRVAAHEVFLLLGPKGSGKSAAAWYVALTWEKEFGQEAVFHEYLDFDELNRTQTPLTSLDRTLVGEEVVSLTDAAWLLFIGVRLLQSLANDPACNLSQDPRLFALLKQLKQAGLASDDYPQVLRKVRERNGIVGFKDYLSIGGKTVESDSLSPRQVAEAIVNLIERAQTPNRHLLSIDGLDKAVTQHDSYWRTLAALVRVADSLNRRLSSSRHAYVLVMCRNDVFRKVPFADGPKIAADSSESIEWGAESANPRKVRLWDYLAKKAEIAPADIFARLPKSVKVGAEGGVETSRYLLSFTRYTPRDMSVLFTELKREYPGSGVVPREIVRTTADRFASNHLLREILAEATGLLPTAVIERIPSVLSALPRRVFNRSEWNNALNEAGVMSRISPAELGEYLFLQGAIGNYRPEVNYVQFYHRRDAYAYGARGPWILHTGLTYALNIPWAGPA